MSNLKQSAATVNNESGSFYLALANAHKRWLCEKYETARRVEHGLSPNNFGYGYFDDPNFYFDQDETYHNWLAAELGKLARGKPALVRRSGNGSFWERDVITLLRWEGDCLNTALIISPSLIGSYSRRTWRMARRSPTSPPSTAMVPIGV